MSRTTHRRLRFAFTILEVLVAVVVIGVMSALALAKFGEVKEKAYVDAMRNDLHNYVTAAELTLDQTGGAYPASPSDLTGYHYSPDVSTFGYQRLPSGYQLLVKHAKTPTLCLVTVTAAQSAPMVCSPGLGLSIVVSDDAPAVGVPVTFDASSGVPVSGKQGASLSKGTASLAGKGSATFAGRGVPQMLGDRQLSSAEIASVTSVHWNFGDGTYVSDTLRSALIVTHAFPVGGRTYQVKAAVTLASGEIVHGEVGVTTQGTSADVVVGDTTTAGVGDTSTVVVGDTTTVVLNQDPIADFTASPDRGLAGEAITFTSTSSDADGTIASLSWDFADFYLSTDANPTHTFTGPGPYLVSLTVTDNAGGQATVIHSITVDTALVAQFSPTDTSIIAGQSVTFDAHTSTGSGVTYAWTFHGGETATGSTAEHTFSTAGIETVSLTITDAQGRTAQSATTVTVTEAPNILPTASFTKSAGTAATSAPITFTSTSTDSDGSIASQAWAFDDSTTATASSVSHAFSTSGMHHITLTVTDNRGGTASHTDSVAINNPPTANFTSSPVYGVAGQAMAFTSTSVDVDGTITSQYWDWADQSYTTALNPSHTFIAPGSWNVLLRVTDNGLATGEVTKTIVVDSAVVSSFTVPDTNPLTNSSMTFNAAASKGTSRTYAWVWGDGTAAGTGVSKAHTFTVAKTDTVRLTVTDLHGHTAVSQQIMTPHTNAPPVVSSLTGATAPGSGTAQTYTAVASDVDNNLASLTFAWGDGTANTVVNSPSASTAVSHTWAAAGSDTITVTATDAQNATGTRTLAVTPIAAPGTAFEWGSNIRGQLGDSTTTDRWVPTAVVAGGMTFASLAIGYQHTCGLTSGGVAYCWGYNGNGQLGDGTWTNRSVPTAVSAGGLTFASLAAGEYFTCGLTSGGVAYCWGYNLYGQLGTGNGIDRLTPTAVSAGGLVFATLKAGANHTCGLTVGGVAYCWGYNGNGQLGDGTTLGKPVPTAVSGGNTFTSLTAGLWHNCGITSGGVAYCWGINRNGQIGDNTSGTYRLTPTAVSGGKTFAMLTAGQDHTCGLTSGSETYCWGYNLYGQIGNNTSGTNRLVPTAVSVGVKTFTSLVAGPNNTCGLTSGGVAYCWGRNSSGVLGDGTSGTNRLVPTAVAGGLIFRQLFASSNGSYTAGLIGP